MDKPLKVLQFIIFVILAIIPFKLLSYALSELTANYYNWGYDSFFSIFYWIVGTMVFVTVATVILGFIELLIKKINPFLEQSITAYVIVPLFIGLTLLQLYDMWAVIEKYGFILSQLLYVPFACLFFSAIYMSIKLCSIVIKKY